MIQIGKINTLTVKESLPYGIHLDDGEAGSILLRNRYVPEKCQPGDELEVFISTDK